MGNATGEKVLIAGKEVELRFDLEAMDRFKKQTGKNFFSLSQRNMEPKDLAVMIKLAAKRCGYDLEDDEVMALMPGELEKIQEAMFGEIGEAEGKSGNPPKKGNR